MSGPRAFRDGPVTFRIADGRQDPQPKPVVWSRSKYTPRLNVPKAQRKALKEMVAKYGRSA